MVREKARKHRVIYEINVRPWLREISDRHGKKFNLAEVPESELDQIAGQGIEWVWLMGVWQTGSKAREIALTHPGLQQEYIKALPDLGSEDVVGSPYSIADYSVSPHLGGPEALAELRRRLAQRGIGLILDFVVNHTGIDFPWLTQRPDLYIQGTLEDLHRSPQDFFELQTNAGLKILAHGKDPYFPGWTDTAQLNLLHPETRAGLRSILKDIADQCDGVRCDMAMLGLNSLFRQIWDGHLAGLPRAEGELWPELLEAVRSEHPDFLFLAEVYWGLEGRIRALGFDYTYDKALCEHLIHGSAVEVRRHLEADLWYQFGAIRFLENHDEPRVAGALPWERHRAAALVESTVPGMVLFHEGQLEGRRTKIPVQLGRRPMEPVNQEVQSFYRRLLEVLRDPVLQQGEWQLFTARPAWEGNPTWQNFLAYEWRLDDERRWVIANFAPVQGQCYLAVGQSGIQGEEVELTDLLGSARYLRQGSKLRSEGLYLDMPPYGIHLFEVISRVAAKS